MRVKVAAMLGEGSVSDARKDPKAVRRSSRRTSNLRPGKPDVDELAILNEVARIATLDLEVDSTLQRITDALADQFGWEFVGCAIVDNDRRRYVCRALTTSLETSIFVGYSSEFGSGVLGEVARRGRTIIVDDVRTSKIYQNAVPTVRSEICVPVCHRDQLVAVLDIESTEPGAFRTQKRLVETVARQIAGVVASARLHEEVRLRAGQLEMMSEISKLVLDADDLGVLLERVVGFVHERFCITATAALLVDEQMKHIELAAAAGTLSPSEVIGATWPVVGIVGRAMRTGETVLVPDVSLDPEYIELHPGVKSEFVIPFRHRDIVLGALNLESTNPEVFTEEKTRMLEMLASQVAGGIYTARMNKRLAATNRLVEDRTRELEMANKQLQLANQILMRLSTHDGLTGVGNRRQFDEALDVEWRRASRVGGLLSLIMIDIDFFKDYNDRYGHQAGDDCLKAVAYTLQDLVHRAGDVLARYGGEEFAIILPGLPREEALLLAESLRRQVESRHIRHAASAVTPFVTVSLGVASTIVPRDGDSADLVAAADRALYAAKGSGRNRVEYAELKAVEPLAGKANERGSTR